MYILYVYFCNYPEIAALVFDRCITVAQGNFRVDDPAFWIEFNYEYIDDTYASWDDDDQLDIKGKFCLQLAGICRY